MVMAVKPPMKTFEHLIWICYFDIFKQALCDRLFHGSLFPYIPSHVAIFRIKWWLLS